MRTQAGVTLIEFLIGFTLLGVLVALAVPSFRDWIINSQIRTATDGIDNGLKLARSEAVRRNSPVRFRLPSSTASGWAVEAYNRATAGWDSYQVRDASEGTAAVTVTASQDTVIFIGDGRVSPAPSSAITFDVSHSGGGSCITSAGAGDMRCLRVTVSAGGSVRMCDPALASTNVASC